MEFLETQPFSSEVWVVNNASTDSTPEIIAAFAERYPSLQGITENQPGKGAAVRRGMLTARGKYRFMADADLSMPITEVVNFVPPQMKDFDVAIASREATGSIRYDEPPYRHWGGRLMNWIIQLLILPGIQDTQCGFKCFTEKAAEDLFRQQTLNGWSFDIELLYLARQQGYQIQEVPIPWYYRQESKVSALQDALKIITDMIKIRRNAYQGVYDPKN